MKMQTHVVQRSYFYDKTYFELELHMKKIADLTSLVGNVIEPQDFKHFQLVDELYGTGDFDENVTLTEDVDKHMASSVESLVRLFRREEAFISQLRDHLEGKSDGRREVPGVSEIITAPKFPVDMNDFLAGSAVGLYRIQSVHNIPYEDMARGQLRPHLPASPHSLNWVDGLRVAEVAKQKHDLEKVVEWLQLTVDLAEYDNLDLKRLGPLRTMLKDATAFHDAAALKHGKFTAGDYRNPSVTRIDPFNVELAKRNRKKVKIWHKEWETFLGNFPMFKDKPDDVLQTLDQIAYQKRIEEQCQDLPDSKFIFHSTTLKCQNLHKNLPVLRLGPIKLEVYSEQPVVASFHDFMGPGECEAMKSRGRNRMKATPLTTPKNSRENVNEAYTDRRVSKIRYLSHKLDDMAWRINTRISNALEFDLNGLPIPAENFQLMNYGIGGFIELHIDSNSKVKNEFDYTKPEEWLIQSERLMTFMVYLSDVEAGGHTVFPNLGLSVPPVRGSALFWHTVNSVVSQLQIKDLILNSNKFWPPGYYGSENEASRLSRGARGQVDCEQVGQVASPHVHPSLPQP